MDMWTDERSMVSTLFVIRIQELDGSMGVHWVRLLLLLFALDAQGGKKDGGIYQRFIILFFLPLEDCQIRKYAAVGEVYGINQSSHKVIEKWLPH